MIIESLFAITLQVTQWPEPAELRTGEVMRLYQRTMSRRGQFESILVVTPNKAFLKQGDVRNWTMLTSAQQAEVKAIFANEPAGLRTKKRSNPMWPSAYDGSDEWMSYRVKRSVKTWTNREYEFPEESSLSKFVEALRTQLGPNPG